MTAERSPTRPASKLREVRRQLGQGIVEAPKLLLAKFDRYVDAVAAHCGFRLEPVRAHLESGFGVVRDVLDEAEALDPRSLADLDSSLEQSAKQSNTVGELVAAYRKAVADVGHALARPIAARHDRSLRRARDYIREHLAEALSLEKVASVAGFAPAYFSRTFARNERATFQAYVRRLRLEKAKDLLESSSLSVEQVGKISGFRTRSLFHAAFKRGMGVTPHAYRAK